MRLINWYQRSNDNKSVIAFTLYQGDRGAKGSRGSPGRTGRTVSGKFLHGKNNKQTKQNKNETNNNWFLEATYSALLEICEI